MGGSSVRVLRGYVDRLQSVTRLSGSDLLRSIRYQFQRSHQLRPEN